jgi:heat shock protein HtpX
MIMALRKIENRGELERANSAVMEMCIDNPRVGFANVFDTHPPIEARCDALVKFAGGHDPGPLQLEAPPEQAQLPPGEGPWGGEPQGAPPSGPWSDQQPAQQSGKPFLPSEPPLGGPPPGGPWGPKRG